MSAKSWLALMASSRLLGEVVADGRDPKLEDVTKAEESAAPATSKVNKQEMLRLVVEVFMIAVFERKGKRILRLDSRITLSN